MNTTNIFGLQKPSVTTDIINDLVTAISINADITEMEFLKNATAISNMENWTTQIANATSVANSAHANSVQAVQIANDNEVLVTDADTNANSAVSIANNAVAINTNTLVIAENALTVANEAQAQTQVNLQQLNNLIFSSAIAAPTTGTWVISNKVYNSNPIAGGYIGWVCITSGTPGVWKGFGLIQA